MMQTYSGYDPASPTLVKSQLYGDCLRGIIDECFRTVYLDRAAPIRSGDFVRLWISYPDGVVTGIIKRAVVSRDGRWWGLCSDGVFQIGTLVRPFNIERVVALSTEVLVSNPPVRRKAPPELAAHYAMLAQEVVDEWREHGHVDGVPFPGLNRLNYFLPDMCTRNPEYCPPVPL